jgi:starch phosphorylase
MAEELVQGVDVWITTPRRPWEASGTSGMKVLANGGLNLSIADGWWAEVDTPGAGWTIAAPPGTNQDLAEAEALYGLLENEIVPLFYTRRDDGLPADWLTMVRTSVTALTARFSTERMVRDYTDEVYLPAASAYRARVADHCASAASILAWQRELAAHWDGVAFEALRVLPSNDATTFEADVRLGALSHEAVAVELFADTPGENGTNIMPERVAMQPAGEPRPGVVTFRAQVTSHRPPGDYTARVVPHHPAASVPLEAPQITWYR